jgi:hypothetical protein
LVEVGQGGAADRLKCSGARSSLRSSNAGMMSDVAVVVERTVMRDKPPALFDEQSEETSP